MRSERAKAFIGDRLNDVALFQLATSSNPEFVRRGKRHLAKQVREILEAAYAPPMVRVRDHDAIRQEYFEDLLVEAGLRLGVHLGDIEAFIDELAQTIDDIIEIRISWGKAA